MTLQDVNIKAGAIFRAIERCENYEAGTIRDSSTLERDEMRYEYYEQFADKYDVSIFTAMALLRNLQAKPFWKIKQHARIVDHR